MVNAFARASMSGARLFEVLDREPDIADRPGARDLVVTDAVLRFEHVSFAYPGEGRELPTLHDISFEVRAGQTLGIVGPPGSGKSTIAHLIPRYYDVSAGRITIDGQDVRDVTLASLRRTRQPGPAGHLPVHRLDREQHRLRRSLGRPRAHRPVERGRAAARLHRRPAEGLRDAGRRARRVALGRPAPAPVDRPQHPARAADPGVRRLRPRRSTPRTEQGIREALRTQTATRATIIIAHRLGSLMDADEIVFLEQGRIVERGTPRRAADAGRPLRQPLRAAEPGRRAAGAGDGGRERAP